MPVSSPVYRWRYQTRTLLGTLLATLPGLIGLAISVAASMPLWTAVAIWLGVLVVTMVLILEVRRRAIYPLQTLSNLLEALREGDYSLRGSRAQRHDAVGEVVWEINALANTLRNQRLAVEEKSALLAKVIETLDIAVFAFDEDGSLKLANPAGEKLLGAKVHALKGRNASELGLSDYIDVPLTSLVERSFPGASGRWEIRHARFREEGRPHDLIVITDLSRALREEERLAWQRLLRVLGHELNNSLTPIRSMSATLRGLLDHDPLAADWREDVGGGLQVIGDRAEALARFMARYTALARLPAPQLREVAFEDVIQRVAQLEDRVPMTIDNGPALRLDIDADQIEQALINLVRNAAESSLSTGGGVCLGWSRQGEWLRVQVIDDGIGRPSSENLFVPFFTTKPGGSGIGLVLARQIVEGHGGTLTLRDRDDRTGCIAEVCLPL